MSAEEDFLSASNNLDKARADLLANPNDDTQARYEDAYRKLNDIRDKIRGVAYGA